MEIEYIRLLHVTHVTRIRDHQNMRIGNRRSELFRYIERAATIGISPDEQRRYVDTRQQGSRVDLANTAGIQAIEFLSEYASPGQADDVRLRYANRVQKCL